MTPVNHSFMGHRIDLPKGLQVRIDSINFQLTHNDVTTALSVPFALFNVIQHFELSGQNYMVECSYFTVPQGPDFRRHMFRVQIAAGDGVIAHITGPINYTVVDSTAQPILGGAWQSVITNDIVAYNYWLAVALKKLNISSLVDKAFALVNPPRSKLGIIPVTIVDDQDDSLQQGRCESCTFWGGGDLDDRKSCLCPKFHYGYGPVKNRTPDMVDIEDDVGWGMLSGPKFGCVHWAIDPKLWVMGE